ncbi:Aste57867_14001 [Aphanomyces stellatus]|uniref:Aste57867_14001 protein n=1 Tax=Aphanomyces stellatus TaxID=120398 RepID=A0A485L099_9STRA|nr:hypothetical protein As57867_013950 [Aphanomyces stellatus]VFT90831.1 Aste57867_14001 [Aphanomyces stellatus]
MDATVEREVQRYTQAALQALESIAHFRLSYLRGELKKHLPTDVGPLAVFVDRVVAGIAKHICLVLDSDEDAFVLVPSLSTAFWRSESRCVEAMAAKCTAKVKTYLRNHAQYPNRCFPVFHLRVYMRKFTPADRRGLSWNAYMAQIAERMVQTRELCFGYPRAKGIRVFALPPAKVAPVVSICKPKIDGPSVVAQPPIPSTQVKKTRIDSLESLVAILASAEFQSHSVVAVSCELSACPVISMATTTATYNIDCRATGGVSAVVDVLRPHFENAKLTKVWFGVHSDAAALQAQAQGLCLVGTWDVQLALERQSGKSHLGFQDVLTVFPALGDKMVQDGRGTGLPWLHLMLEVYLAHFEPIDTSFCPSWNLVQMASDARVRSAIALNGQRKFAFDKSHNHALASYELLATARPNDRFVGTPLVVNEDLELLLEFLPSDLTPLLETHEITSSLMDICLDMDRRPSARLTSGVLIHLGDDNRVITSDDLEFIVAMVGTFGANNRAHLVKQLHRISALRNRNQDIVGLTMRVGRHVPGLSTFLLDILLASEANVLFLGEPGSGKTTLLRDVARELAFRRNVYIVDTNDEIAGDGDKPHPCVGLARRITVPSLDAQSAIMVECVQNHTPQVLLVDEIGRASEVEAARTCKQRGVRMIASAHGSLRKLLKNKPLRGLVGGIESVTVGDTQVAQHVGDPVFDVVVELEKGQYNTWRVVLDAAAAVHAIANGKLYMAQVRSRVADDAISIGEVEA